MYFGIEVVNVKGIGRSSDVALLIPIGSHNSVHIGDEHVMAKIEFAVLIEERSIKVHLNNICSFGLGIVLLQ